MSAAPYDRLRLSALRYAVNDESEQYVAVMRVFAAGTAGLLSDLSAREVADSLSDSHVWSSTSTSSTPGCPTWLTTATSRETEARSIREYLTTRARYQLTQRGELVHRQVEELLAATDEVREVSTEMPGQAATVFAQFERLVTSTRAFYARLDRHVFSAGTASGIWTRRMWRSRPRRRR